MISLVRDRSIANTKLLPVDNCRPAEDLQVWAQQTKHMKLHGVE